MPPSTCRLTIRLDGSRIGRLGRGIKVTDPPSGVPSPDPDSWLGRVRTFLGSHPTPWPGINSFIWIWAAVVAIVLATNIPSSIATATGSSPTTDGATAHTVTPLFLRVAPFDPTISTPPTSTADTGGIVINSAGAILPNPTRTPGAVNPNVTQANIDSTICTSGWTSTIRPSSTYTTALKQQQLASGYAYNGIVSTSYYQEDHLIPLQLGGSPTSVLNLWPEPNDATSGAATKRQLENKLKSLVCDGTLSLAAAQQAIATNWYDAYQAYVVNPAQTTAVATTALGNGSGTLTCSASISDPAPTDNSTVDVIVDTLPGVAVTATAHYKTTDTTRSGDAEGGVADIGFDISDATIGYPVVVDVTVDSGDVTATCSTVFTPA
jgi:NAD(P)H-hydrate repair Nnr-like enzyme with NAD(P)H-hydrate epimerase domain